MNRIVVSLLVDSAQRHDSKLLEPHLPTIDKYAQKPIVLTTDSAWDVQRLRTKFAKKNIALHAATNVRRNKNRRKIIPGGRWRVEQLFGILNWNRGIKFCWAKLQHSFLALCQFAASIHNFKLIGIFG